LAILGVTSCWSAPFITSSLNLFLPIVISIFFPFPRMSWNRSRTRNRDSQCTDPVACTTTFSRNSTTPRIWPNTARISLRCAYVE
jgi:hypothetical protein